MSGRNCAQTSANPTTATPSDLVMPTALSDANGISTFASMTKPSCSITLYVSPNSGERCAPVTAICSSRSAQPLIPCSTCCSKPYSARLPVTTQIFRPGMALARCQLGAGWQLDDRGFQTLCHWQWRAAAVCVHRQAVQQRPQGAAVIARSHQRTNDVVPLLDAVKVDPYGVQPEIADAFGRLVDEVHVLDALKLCAVRMRQAALARQHLIEPLHLRTTHGRIQIGHPIVVANLVMEKFPWVRQLRRRRQMTGAPGQRLVICENRAPTAGGNDLVAVEAQGTGKPECAGVLPAN